LRADFEYFPSSAAIRQFTISGVMIMRTMFINCLVGMSLFTAAASAQTIQYRWTERHNQNVIGPGQIPVPNDNTVGTGTDATFWLALEARVIGGGSLGVSSFSGDVIMNDAFGTRGFFWGAASTQPDAAAGSMVNSARSNASFNTRYRGYTGIEPWPTPEIWLRVC
jgi:hypothetical protein